MLNLLGSVDTRTKEGTLPKTLQTESWAGGEQANCVTVLSGLCDNVLGIMWLNMEQKVPSSHTLCPALGQDEQKKPLLLLFCTSCLVVSSAPARRESGTRPLLPHGGVKVVVPGLCLGGESLQGRGEGKIICVPEAGALHPSAAYL